MEQVNALKSQYDETGILTIYLNTDAGDRGKQGQEWKIRLKNGLKRLKEYIEKSGSKEELKAFKSLADQVNQAITDQQRNFQKSYIYIATASGDVLVEKIVQAPVETSFHWEKEPVTDQLEQIQKTYPATGIVLMQKSEVLFIDAALGEIREEKRYNWEAESEDWREYKGNAPPERTASGTTQVDEVERRFDENRIRWYKKLAPLIDKEIKNRHLSGLYLVGSKEYLRDIEKHLGSKIMDTIPKNLISKPSHEVLNVVYDKEVR